jgi:hypothetical protein
MSKGPGRVERELLYWLQRGGDEAAFALEQLCWFVYGPPDDGPPPKAQQIVIVRAANNIIRRGGNYAWHRWSGGRGSRKILYVPDNLVSYAKACIASNPHSWVMDDWEETLQQPRYRDLMQPGGAWWRNVEIIKAERAGDADRVAALTAEPTAEHAAGVGAIARLLQSLRAEQDQSA